VFDPKAEPGKKVQSVWVGDQPLIKSRVYVVSSNSFPLDGNDGYASLK
jgi:hypothetical protein